MINIRTPAKINLCLHVLNKRDDGYHNIISLMQCVSIFDTLLIEPSEKIELESSMDVPAEQNLVYRAAMLLREQTGSKMGARIRLDKEIPSGAGLGGGSSDAAAAICSLNKLWKTGLDINELKALGALLGSDVPFFIQGPLAIAEGRGEKLSSISPAVSFPVVLVKPDVSVPTPWAYSMLRRSGELTNQGSKIDNIKLIYQAIRQGDYTLFSSLASNDFEDAVMDHFPVINEIKGLLKEQGACASLMSGSGSSVFGIFRNSSVAEAAASALSDRFWCRAADSLTEMPYAAV